MRGRCGAGRCGVRARAPLIGAGRVPDPARPGRGGVRPPAAGQGGQGSRGSGVTPGDGNGPGDGGVCRRARRVAGSVGGGVGRPLLGIGGGFRAARWRGRGPCAGWSRWGRAPVLLRGGGARLRRLPLGYRRGVPCRAWVRGCVGGCVGGCVRDPCAGRCVVSAPTRSSGSVEGGAASARPGRGFRAATAVRAGPCARSARSGERPRAARAHGRRPPVGCSEAPETPASPPT